MKTADELREIIRAACKKAGGTQAWGEANNISYTYVYEVLRGVREPSAMIANKVGYRRVLRYERFETKE